MGKCVRARCRHRTARQREAGCGPCIADADKKQHSNDCMPNSVITCYMVRCVRLLSGSLIQRGQRTRAMTVSGVSGGIATHRCAWHIRSLWFFAKCRSCVLTVWQRERRSHQELFRDLGLGGLARRSVRLSRICSFGDSRIQPVLQVLAAFTQCAARREHRVLCQVGPLAQRDFGVVLALQRYRLPRQDGTSESLCNAPSLDAHGPGGRAASAF